MTLTDVLTELATRGALKRSRVPAMQTSLKYLAAALGSGSPDEYPADAALCQEATWGKALEDHWCTLEAQGRTISAYTRRNVRNDIRKVFRLAEAHGLLRVALPSALLTKPKRVDFQRQHRATTPYQTTYRNQGAPRHFGLPEKAWPPDIQEGWLAYQAKCDIRLRQTTFRSYTKCLVTYLGYLANIGGRTPTWEDLFSVAQLRKFLHWHGARLERPISVHGRQVVVVVVAIANVIEHQHAAALAAFLKTLKAPAPLHNKRLHMVTLRELEAVAEACLAEGRAPCVVNPRVRHPGVTRASRFQRGLILKLLVRAPLRQRNVRELRLEHNLYKDPQTGHWHLHFRGDELKIGTRGGRVNEYKMNLTEDTDGLIPALEEFLSVYRPHLPNAATSPFLFLTQCGGPFSAGSLYHELAYNVAMRTGKRFYPHLIRTIWATEYLTSDDVPDWTTAAVMLGDKVGTVMASYHDLEDQAHHVKGKAFVAKQLRTG